jgi:hypothetical protein
MSSPRERVTVHCASILVTNWLSSRPRLLVRPGPLSKDYHLRRKQGNVTGSASDVQNPHSLLNCRLSEETLRNWANNLRLSYQALQFRRSAAKYISRVHIPCSFLKNVFVLVRCSMSGSLSLLNFVLPVIAYRLFQKLTNGLQYFAGKRFIRYRARKPDCADQCAIG